MSISENDSPNKIAAPEQDAAWVARLKNIRTLTITVSILTGMASIGLFILFTSQPAWQIIVLALLYAVTSVLGVLVVRRLFPKKIVFLGVAAVSLVFGIAITSTAAFLTGIGFPAAVVFLIFSLVVSSLILVDWQANVLIGYGILAAGAAAMLTDFSPVQQLSVQIIAVLTPAILGILFMIYVVMLTMQFVTATLRIRLVTVFIAIVIIPLVFLSAIQSRFMFSVLTDEVNKSLELAAQQTSFGVERFLDDTQRSVAETAKMDILASYLSMPPESRKGSQEEQAMRMTLHVLDSSKLESNHYISSYLLLNISGMVEYDSLSENRNNRYSPDSLKAMGIDINAMQNGEPMDENQQAFFQVPMTTGAMYISPLKIVSNTQAFFFISAPVRNQSGEIVGVLSARNDGAMLQNLLKSYSGLLGEDSYAILFDEYNIRLADTYTPNNIYKAVASLPKDTIQLLQSSQRLPDLPAASLSTNYTELDRILNNYDPAKPVFMTNLSPSAATNVQQIGAVSRIRGMPWKVVYLRADFNNDELRSNQRRLTTMVTTLIAMVVGVVAVVTSQLLSQPIIRLTKIAQQISSGDLDAQAPVRSADEFGMLGMAFNSMTSQMRALIAQLEEHVQDRTKEIEHQKQNLEERARQLQTISEVARQIVSSQELEALLTSVTRLISDRFGFYHVGIFLLDEKREFAVLRASNSEGGQHMLARGHKLPVGRVGIVGYATGTGQARVATDVGEDAIYFNNPDLPATRSEMTLPLKVGEHIIGALDIQSTRANDFRQEDIEVFSTLADQVAIAIYNNQLYIETLQALDEAQNLHRQYLRSEWTKDLERRRVRGYLFNQAGITPQQSENPLWKKVFSSGEPMYAVLPSNDGALDNAVMAVPISVRGETIGVIHVQDQGDERLWSEDEIAMVNSIANQVAVALENARLFENTVRRAEREKKVLQITAKIRSTNDPQQMLQVALDELQQALHASRAQIYLREESTESSEDQSYGNSNGRSGNMPRNGSPVEK